MRESSGENANRDLMGSVLVGAPDPEIVALETRLRSAQLAADVNELDGLISKDLVFYRSGWSTGDQGRRSGDLKSLPKHVFEMSAATPAQLQLRSIFENNLELATIDFP